MLDDLGLYSHVALERILDLFGGRKTFQNTLEWPEIGMLFKKYLLLDLFGFLMGSSRVRTDPPAMNWVRRISFESIQETWGIFQKARKSII